MNEIKTKDFQKFLTAVNAGEKALVVTPEMNEKVIKSARNIPGVDTAVVTAMSVYDIMNHGKCIITRDAVAVLEEVYA